MEIQQVRLFHVFNLQPSLCFLIYIVVKKICANRARQTLKTLVFLSSVLFRPGQDASLSL